MKAWKKQSEYDEGHPVAGGEVWHGGKVASGPEFSVRYMEYKINGKQTHSQQSMAVALPESGKNFNWFNFFGRVRDCGTLMNHLPR